MKVCTEVTDKEELNAGEGVRSGKRVYFTDKFDLGCVWKGGPSSIVIGVEKWRNV